MKCSRFRAAYAALLLAASCAAPAREAARDAQLESISAAWLAPFLARVEAVRGLRFVHSVTAWQVAPGALPALLERELDRSASRQEITRESELAASLGLLPPGFDLRAAVLHFEAEDAAGFYSPLAGRIYVVDGEASAGGRSGDALLVHEVAHALQAQHSGLFPALIGIRGDDDLVFALSALLEGEATYIELEDAEAQGGVARPTPAAFAQRFSVAAIAPQLPRVLAETFVAPYSLGYALAEGLAARGGASALDAAYRDPPLTSEELRHPRQYFDAASREPLAELPREPRLDSCRVLTSNCYGELGVQAWLEDLGANAEEASRAATGWDADRAWRFACGARRASAWLLEYDDEQQALELALAVRALKPATNALALELSLRAGRLLVSTGLDAAQRAQLLAAPEARRFERLGDYLAAHPDVRACARRLLP